MLRNSASEPEISLPGRILAGLLPGKNRNRPSGRPKRANFGAFPVAVRPKYKADFRPGELLRNIGSGAMPPDVRGRRGGGRRCSACACPAAFRWLPRPRGPSSGRWRGGRCGGVRRYACLVVFIARGSGALLLSALVFVFVGPRRRRTLRCYIRLSVIVRRRRRRNKGYHQCT
jgi:hypothetical protein